MTNFIQILLALLGFFVLGGIVMLITYFIGYIVAAIVIGWLTYLLMRLWFEDDSKQKANDKHNNQDKS